MSGVIVAADMQTDLHNLVGREVGTSSGEDKHFSYVNAT